MNSLTDLTTQLLQLKHLTAPDVAQAVTGLLDDTISEDAKAEFLTALARKGETTVEIAAFARELRARAINPSIDPAQHGGVLLDIVGTGADMANTFNISSCVVFVAAAAGVAVVKHGNRAITSKCGSADVLAALGVNIELTPAQARHCLATAGITFFFAPAYHPAFKHIAPVRKRLATQKQRTVFNILGPLVNPAQPSHMLVGVFDPALVQRYAEVLQLLGVKRALVAHGAGLDELSTMGVNTVAELWGGRIEITQRDFRVPHSELRLMDVTPAELTGGDPAYSAGIVREVLSGKHRGPRRDIVLLNAAAALVVAEKADDFLHGWRIAAELIDSGQAAAKLDQFVTESHRP